MKLAFRLEMFGKVEFLSAIFGRISLTLFLLAIFSATYDGSRARN